MPTSSSEYHQKLIRIFLTTKSVWYSGQVSWRVLQSLTLLHIFHIPLARIPLYLGIQEVLIMLFEVPTGIIGDTLGRKRAFLLSILSYGCACVFIALVPIFPSLYSLGLFTCIVFTAFGWTFQSGALEAWLTHNLRLGEYQGEFHKTFALREVFRSAAAMFIGPVYVSLFYFWTPAPWLLALIIYFSSGMILLIATKNISDHEVGHREFPTASIFLESAKKLTKTTAAALREQPILRAWIAIGSMKTILMSNLVKFHTVWLDRFPGKEFLISIAWIVAVGSAVVGGLIARKFSYQKKHAIVYHFGIAFLALLPSIFFYLPLSQTDETVAALSFIAAFGMTVAAGLCASVVADGQYNHGIKEDGARNTLISSKSLIEEGFVGFFLIIWGLLPSDTGTLRLLFQITPLIAAALLAYSARIVYRETE